MVRGRPEGIVVRLMKRYFILIILLFTPLSIWAMTPISDDELADISGQTGVSIWVDITMNIHIDCIAWGDSDGIGGSSYWSTGTSAQDVVINTASVSIAGNPLLQDILDRYRSSSGVSFFPDTGSIDFVNGVPRFR